MNLDGRSRLLLGYNPTYGPDVKLWHGAAPFALFKGRRVGDEGFLSGDIISSKNKL